MEYKLDKDMKVACEILNLSKDELARKLNIEPISIRRIEKNETKATTKILETFYNFAYAQGLSLSRLRSMFYLEELDEFEMLLYHGSKQGIEGSLSLTKGRSNNDFGRGFYLGEYYEQAATFLAHYEGASIYLFKINLKNLNVAKLSVSTKWMLIIAYYRGRLKAYEDSNYLQTLIREIEDSDIIMAPIADNRMFQILDSFIDGEITDEQCCHALAAMNLGNQIVCRSELALSKLEMLERCYYCEKEKDYYRELKKENQDLGYQKVRMARIEYRGKGKYIEELLNETN